MSLLNVIIAGASPEIVSPSSKRLMEVIHLSSAVFFTSLELRRGRLVVGGSPTTELVKARPGSSFSSAMSYDSTMDEVRPCQGCMNSHPAKRSKSELPARMHGQNMIIMADFGSVFCCRSFSIRVEMVTKTEPYEFVGLPAGYLQSR